MQKNDERKSSNNTQPLDAVDKICLKTLIGKRFACRCIYVYDGNMIGVIMYINRSRYIFNVFMVDYLAPSIFSLNDHERLWAKIARHDLTLLILGKKIQISCENFNDEGRIFAVVYKTGVNINTLMEGKPYTVQSDRNISTKWRPLTYKKFVMKRRVVNSKLYEQKMRAHKTKHDSVDL